jgi:hypothetical protein
MNTSITLSDENAYPVYAGGLSRLHGIELDNPPKPNIIG